MPDEQYQTSEYKCKADQLRSVLDDRQRRRAAGEEFSDLSLVADHSDLMPELAEELYKRRRIEAARKQAALGSAAGDVTGDSDAVVMDELKRLLASHDRAERPTMLFASAQPDRPVQQPTRNTAVSPGRWFVNRIRDFLRHNRRRHAQPVHLLENGDGKLVYAAPGTSDLARLQRQEEIAQLPVALNELDADDHELIIAHYLQNTPFHELTDRFAMSEDALRQKAHGAIAKLERAQRLLAAMHRKHMPPHYRKVLCAVRLRNWPVLRIAAEFELSESAVQELLQCAEVWMASPGDAR